MGTIPKDFYLGRIFDSQSGETTDEPLAYDPDDLTTHAAIVGMTGSGKTGLCLDLMEEAGLHKIPALMIDLKGDITNAVLHFPNLEPADFEPWVNADDAKRSGKTVAEAAEGTANLWRNGLAQWDIGPGRIQQLSDSVRFAIYTPGSDAGLPISILSSLSAPDIPWEGNEEILRERIGATVTAVLGLIGMTDIDPVRSREHILLSNIFEHAWSNGLDLDLGEIIMQTQSPPFEKLGVFDINRFFPEKDRFNLAIQLNNILAAPSFQSWIKGQPLDIEQLLYMPDGQPRHTIFYLAHLNEAERMFFVTLLYGAVESWMRTQSGTGSLRALVYFDEIFGYLPPTANPPSKEPMLRMLKQARAFGVGMVLATQNPVDIDYKALSNAGTWFIGKLATEQDKNRLLDGLESAMASSGALDRKEYDRLISSMGKRVFLVRNVHEKRPTLFQTRWAMNYLAGPMTRTQIPSLNELVDAGSIGDAPVPKARSAAKTATSAAATATAATPVETEEKTVQIGTATRPAIPGRIAEYFLPANLDFQAAADAANRSVPLGAEPAGMIYRPTLLAQAEVRFNNRKYNVQEVRAYSAIVEEVDRRGMVRWEEYVDSEGSKALDNRSFDREPERFATFGELMPPLDNSRTIGSVKSDFKDWAYRSSELTIRSNEALKVYGGPHVSAEEFEEECLEAAKKEALAEYEKVSGQYDRKLAAVEKKIKKEERELEEDEAELASRRREEGVRHIETLFKFIGGSRSRSGISSSMSKRRMTSKAKADVEESKQEIIELNAELVELEEAKEDAINEIKEKWEEIALDVSEMSIQPYKKDVVVDLFGIAWMPYHIVDVDGRALEVAAFALE